MADPIPLAAPDGTVYAWRCGADCGRAYAIRRGCPDANRLARDCCAGCPVCRSPHTSGALCWQCLRDARRALEALACLGMAAAVKGTAEAAANLALAEYGYHRRPTAEWLSDLDACAAALCGVDVETVRGWRT